MTDSNNTVKEERIELDENAIEIPNENRKEPKRTLFNDLGHFKNTNVTILTFGGESVRGKLLGYDEVSNCVLEDEKRRKFIVFGKSITMVCEGDLYSL